MEHLKTPDIDMNTPDFDVHMPDFGDFFRQLASKLTLNPILNPRL